eukprot:933911-Prymnesium_polylepis.1
MYDTWYDCEAPPRPLPSRPKPPSLHTLPPTPFRHVGLHPRRPAPTPGRAPIPPVRASDVRLEESFVADAAEPDYAPCRDVYERAIANVPPAPEKRLWR